MTARVLPPEEWPRLKHTELAKVWPTLNRETASVIVVESNGEILGCHVVLPVLHVEGLWVHPDHRGKAGVARRLWAAVKDEAHTRGVRSVMTMALDDRVRGLLLHAGAQPLEGETFLLPVGH